METFFDYKSAYSTRVREILNLLYPNVQVNIINSGISGDNTENGKTRIERDILPFSPDLVVVSYGLNDACGGLDKLQHYRPYPDLIYLVIINPTQPNARFH